MQKFFKGTEKPPFTYPAIVEVRKDSNNYSVWIIGITLLLIIIGVAIFIFKI